MSENTSKWHYAKPRKGKKNRLDTDLGAFVIADPLCGADSRWMRVTEEGVTCKMCLAKLEESDV